MELTLNPKQSAIHNRNVTNEGREHARDELDKLEARSRERSASQSSEGNESNEGNASYEEIRHDENVKRGLKAYVFHTSFPG